MCTSEETEEVPPYRNELFFRKIIANTLTCESLCFFTWLHGSRLKGIVFIFDGTDYCV